MLNNDGVFPCAVEHMTQLTSLCISENPLCSHDAARVLTTMPRLTTLAVEITLCTAGESGIAAALMQLTCLTSLSFVVHEGGGLSESCHLRLLDSLAGAVQHLAPQLRQLSLGIW